jgi:hypothetical protein
MLAKELLKQFDTDDEFYNREDILEMFKYVCDYDTGTYKYPDVHRFISSFYKRRININVTKSIDSFAKVSKLDIKEMIREGSEIIIGQNLIAQEIIKTASLIEFSKIKLSSILKDREDLPEIVDF